MDLRYLISPTTIKQVGYTNENVEDNIVGTTLIRVQDVMLRPIIGTSLFKRLLQGVEDEDLNANEQNLIENYIHPWIICAVDYRITNHLLLEIRAKTVGTTNDQYMQSADERQMLKLQDDLKADVESYRKTLVGFLKDNCDLYPEYKDYICSFENVPPEKNGNAKPNISFI